MPTRSARLLLLVGAEAAAVALLVRLGSIPALALPHGDVGVWLRDTAPTDALAAVLRVVALAGAGWLLGSTVLYLLTGLVAASRRHGAGPAGEPAGRVRRAAAGLTHPAVRRLVDGALACALVTTAAIAPRAAVAATTRPTRPTTTVATTPTTTPTPIVLGHAPSTGEPPPVRDGRAGVASLPTDPAPTTTTTRAPATSRPVTSRPATSTPATSTPAIATAPATAPPVAPGAPVPAAPAPGVATSHVVGPGEHLWAIAAERVATTMGRSARELRVEEIAPYWLAVCDANRASVRSGNVNLIYPGEVVTLPPLA